MKKSAKRGTPAKKKPAPVNTKTALALLEKRLTAATGKPPAPAQLLPALPEVERTLGVDELALGNLGLVEVKLTVQEEAVLSESVPVAELLVKPTGQAYLSHPSYTRWFNRAFGRTGWSLVPASKPMKANNSIVCAYVLHIHRQPAALAWGEQDYFENNREQSYGDALESTVASALRRCAKRLGVGLELWDRAWTDAFLAEHAVRVKVRVKRRGETEEKIEDRWRLKTAAPFWNETTRSSQPRQQQERPQPPANPPAAAEAPKPPPPHAHSGEKITRAQATRFWTLVRNSGRSDEEVQKWLTGKGLASSTDILRADYDAFCARVEATGSLR